MFEGCFTGFSTVLQLLLPCFFSSAFSLDKQWDVLKLYCHYIHMKIICLALNALQHRYRTRMVYSHSAFGHI
ncbi:hypothetical protein L873DRAFT_599578 [Choiromyces venosus 120613-1]|uniref:Secreted protein n=1 Tax=Choiromyces venosus 120613-1 TaxID=1336337 RepID=A0A3N4JX19_9PEZI|nr:hypothetical protein L873DRAFT_599578 [Choiromyces venosus 120613-1]